MQVAYICISVFWLGALVGFLFGHWLGNRPHSVGTIYVTKTEEKTLYSLELDDYPDSIEFKKEVVFKVDASGESLDRE